MSGVRNDEGAARAEEQVTSEEQVKKMDVNQ
jgi:hypothetical protein